MKKFVASLSGLLVACNSSNASPPPDPNAFAKSLATAVWTCNAPIRAMAAESDTRVMNNQPQPQGTVMLRDSLEHCQTAEKQLNALTPLPLDNQQQAAQLREAVDGCRRGVHGAVRGLQIAVTTIEEHEDFSRVNEVASTYQQAPDQVFIPCVGLALRTLRDAKANVDEKGLSAQLLSISNDANSRMASYT